MTSRKRNKGKERKAKKAELEAKRIENERVAMRSRWMRLARGGVNINGQSVECNHGISLVITDEDDHPVTHFIDGMFMYGLNNSDSYLVKYFGDTFTTHQEVWNNKRYREMTANIFVAIGTNMVAGGTKFSGPDPKPLALAIVIFENYDGIGLDSTINSRAVTSKARDLSGSDSSSRRDLLKFFRKRTTCSCLKKMHLEVRKTQPKTGMCDNCNQEKERALLMVCSRCRIEQYCSRECQIADWPKHKCDCDMYVEFQQN